MCKIIWQVLSVFYSRKYEQLKHKIVWCMNAFRGDRSLDAKVGCSFVIYIIRVSWGKQSLYLHDPQKSRPCAPGCPFLYEWILLEYWEFRTQETCHVHFGADENKHSFIESYKWETWATKLFQVSNWLPKAQTLDQRFQSLINIDQWFQLFLIAEMGVSVWGQMSQI